MAAVRDSLCNLQPVQIPRPQISGLQFIPTRGRLGFYKSIRREGEKYGVDMKPIGPRRPALSEDLFVNNNVQQSASVPNAPRNQDEKIQGAHSPSDQNFEPRKVQKSKTVSELSYSSPDTSLKLKKQ